MISTISNTDTDFATGIMAGAAQRLLSELDTSMINGSQSELLREVLRFAARAEDEIGARQTRILKLEAGSRTDDVTGLENERGLRAAVDRLIAASGRYGGSHVMVLLAIDGLDDIRAAHGRTAEQLTLQQLASELRRRTRGSDIVARLSRHEFAALLTPCPAEHATSKSATLAAQLGGLSLQFQAQPLVISVTSGCAAFGADSSYERMMALAHQMLSRRWEPQFKTRPAHKPTFGRRGLVAPPGDSE